MIIRPLNGAVLFPPKIIMTKEKNSDQKKKKDERKENGAMLRCGGWKISRWASSRVGVGECGPDESCCRLPLSLSETSPT